MERNFIKKISYKFLPFIAFGISFFLGSCDNLDIPTSDLNSGTIEDSNTKVSDVENSNRPSDGKHEHKFIPNASNEFLASEATCTHPAIYYYSCSECGEVDYEHTFEHGSTTNHNFTNQVTSSKTLAMEATCTHPASYYYSCTMCSEVDYEHTFEYGSITNHDFTDQVTSSKTLAMEATCTHPATYYYSCTMCGEVDYEHTFEIGSINFDNHTNVATKMIEEASCTKPAFYQDICNDCGGIIKEYYDDIILDHNFSEIINYIYLKESQTCTSPAIYYYSCARCGEIDYGATFEHGEALGHNYVENASLDTLAFEATCEKPATYYYSCSRCHDLSSETFTRGTGRGHNHSPIVSLNALYHEATCTTAATYYYTCDICDKVLNGENDSTFTFGSPNGHSFYRKSITNASLYKEATCTTLAKYYYTCDNCDEVEHISTHTFEYGDYKEHKYIATTSVTSAFAWSASCTAPSAWYYSCEVCHKIDYNHTFEVGEPRGHNYINKQYHYKENLDDEDYVLYTCGACKDIKKEALEIEENSNIYNFTFEVMSEYEKTCKIVSYKTFYGDERDNNITLPSTWKDYKVVAIKDDLFYKKDNIISITIPFTLNYTSNFGVASSLEYIKSENLFYGQIVGYSDTLKHYITGNYVDSHRFPHIRTYFNFVEEKENDEYKYILSKDDNGYFITIIEYKGNATSVIIPDTIDGYNVQRIGYHTFYNNDIVEEIFTPTTLVESDHESIYNCSSLKYLYIKTLRTSNWKNGGSYRSYFGYVSKGTYSNDSGLDLFDYIVYNDGNKTSIMITKVLRLSFVGSNNLYIYDYIKDVTKIGDYDVTTIGSYAFDNNLGIIADTLYKHKVYLPSSIEKIEPYAFSNCKWLYSINFTSSLSYIGERAFICCENLTNVGNTSSVTYVGNSAFSNCYLLEEFNFVEGLEEINGYAFYDCYSLPSIYIPSTLKVLGNGAFSGCEKLANVEFAEDGNITAIPESCFSSTAISNVNNLPNYITSIVYCSYRDCNNLTNINLPDTITSIGGLSFSNCKNVTYVKIGKNVTYLGDNPFSGCSNIEKIAVDKGNKFYTSYQEFFTYLEGINGIVEIKTNTLISGCKNTMLLSNITSLGNDAFDGVTNIIYIPETITSFGRSSLYGIKYIYFESDTLPLKPDGYWNNTNAKTSVYSCGITDEGFVYGVYNRGGKLEATIENYLHNYDYNTNYWDVDIPNLITKKGVSCSFYNDEDPTVSLNHYFSNKEDEKFYVTEIGKNCFKNNKIIQTVSINGNSLVTISEGAFDGCTKLYNFFKIPTSLKEIKDGAFANCTSLTRLSYSLEAEKYSYTVGENNDYFKNAKFI